MEQPSRVGQYARGGASYDYERCGLKDDVKISLDKTDISRAKQIVKYPWFKDKKPWLREGSGDSIHNSETEAA